VHRVASSIGAHNKEGVVIAMDYMIFNWNKAKSPMLSFGNEEN
jgi:hypothetical protein